MTDQQQIESLKKENELLKAKLQRVLLLGEMITLYFKRTKGDLGDRAHSLWVEHL